MHHQLNNHIHSGCSITGATTGTTQSIGSLSGNIVTSGTVNAPLYQYAYNDTVVIGNVKIDGSSGTISFKDTTGTWVPIVDNTLAKIRKELAEFWPEVYVDLTMKGLI